MVASGRRGPRGRELSAMDEKRTGGDRRTGKDRRSDDDRRKREEGAPPDAGERRSDDDRRAAYFEETPADETPADEAPARLDVAEVDQYTTAETMVIPPEIVAAVGEH